MVKCDKDAVVKVLNAGTARDPFLGPCAHNIWYIPALADIGFHVLGKNNTVADLLSRWQYCEQNVVQLKQFIDKPVSLPVDISMVLLDHNL